MEVRILIPPAIQEGEKTDIRDWIAHQQSLGKSDEEIKKLFYALPTDKPTKKKVEEATTEESDAVLDSLGIEVIGQHKDRSVEVYSRITRKSFNIPSIQHMRLATLILFAGEIAERHVTDGQSEKNKGGQWSINVVQNAISKAASKLPTLNESAKREAGCWKEGDSILLVGDRQIAILNGKQEIEKSDKPRHGNQLYQLDGNPDWFDCANITKGIQEVDVESVTFDAVSVLGRWRWKYDTAPELAVGLILATWVQTLWSWRPQVVVTGEANSGKSIFFRALKSIFCGLAGKTARDTTPRGIVQWIGSSSKIVLIDELDRNKYRAEIIEMVRSAGRGDDERWTGTSGQKAVTTKMSNIFWMAGIESGIVVDTDAFRFVRLELLPRLKGSAKIAEPSQSLCETIGRNLLLVAVKHARESVRLAEKLAEIDFDGTSTRVVETYSVPAAIYSLASGLSPEGVLRTFLRNHSENEGETESDLDSLIATILGAHVDAGRELGRRSVEQLIRIAAADHSIQGRREDADDALEKVGIVIQKEKIWINQNDVNRYLLEKTSWKKRNLSEIFLRVDGSKKIHRRKKRFVEINLEIFIDEGDSVTEGDSVDF